MTRYKVGFTLVELLVFMGMFSILIVVLTQIFVSTLDAQKDTEASSSIQQDGNFINSRFIYDMAQAQSIITPSTAGSFADSLQITIAGALYTYALSNGNLTLTDASGTFRLNSYNTTISNLGFLRVGNTSTADNPNPKNTIRMSYTITSMTQKASGTESQNFQVTGGLR